MRPAAIIVMGVSGSGKSTIGALLAEKLGWPFADADGFHPAANVAKMASGQPLTDADRWPWLDAIAAHIATARQAAQPVVVACSALRRAYRERLRAGHNDLLFLHLAGAPEVIAKRQAARQGHFMPPSLMASQFATLEDPAAEADAVTISVLSSPHDVVAAALEHLAQGGPTPPISTRSRSDGII
ncbi:MAG: gluconokinase [Roseomonas sp.]|nr:gluconokinase [Roseomonas sp.]MCA3327744.1 gluconokinase [Roseomonas sp.]MCA3331246.1 gluconokinase [Roseomonas sp.]MCA3334756.1 gluconokinase [Roseomonas sp.]MCA3348161.1 gluconokinase [Roseomonas sp.]